MPKRLFPFLIVLVVMATVSSGWAVGQVLTVQVRDVQMRATPSFTGKPAAKLSYGQQVSVLEERGVWLKTQAPAGVGWVHTTALTSKKIELVSGNKNVAAKADEREVAAAGKGFSPEVEKAYRTKNPGGYAAVEAMLKQSYSPAQLRTFLAAGKVVPQQEAAR